MGVSIAIERFRGTVKSLQKWNPNYYPKGTPVHISTGAAALSYALLLGKRQDTSEKPPHNMAHVILGTSFIWFGW